MTNPLTLFLVFTALVMTSSTSHAISCTRLLHPNSSNPQKSRIELLRTNYLTHTIAKLGVTNQQFSTGLFNYGKNGLQDLEHEWVTAYFTQHSKVHSTGYYSVEIVNFEKKYELMNFVYDRYYKRETVLPKEINLLRDIDFKVGAAGPMRTHYIFLTDLFDKPHFVLRIFDGSMNAPVTGSKGKLPVDWFTINPDYKRRRLPIEIEYPSLKISENELIELGRAAKDEGIYEDLHVMFHRAALWLEKTYSQDRIDRMMIYAECTQEMLRWYVGVHHFEVFAGGALPYDVPTYSISPWFQALPELNGKNRFIIRMSALQFMKLHDPHSIPFDQY